MPRPNIPRPKNSAKALRSPTRELIRQFLRESNTPIKALATMWGVHPNSAYRSMYDFDRPLTVWYVDRVIEHLKLDDFDAAKLRLFAANEAGWNIKPEFLNV
jgi:hypothetical protein